MAPNESELYELSMDYHNMCPHQTSLEAAFADILSTALQNKCGSFCSLFK